MTYVHSPHLALQTRAWCIYFHIFPFSVAFSSGRGDAHQSYDAVLEEFNKDLKAWVYGEPDADVWRSIIRNHDALMDLRHEMFSLFALADPKSQERKRPSYTKELLEWRACLRPFLVNNDGVPAAERPLESMSGLPLSQDAMHLVQIGESRRKQLYQDHLQCGLIPDHHAKQQPVKIALEEEIMQAEEDNFEDTFGDADSHLGISSGSQ